MSITLMRNESTNKRNTIKCQECWGTSRKRVNRDAQFIFALGSEGYIVETDVCEMHANVLLNEWQGFKAEILPLHEENEMPSNNDYVEPKHIEMMVEETMPCFIQFFGGIKVMHVGDNPENECMRCANLLILTEIEAQIEMHGSQDEIECAHWECDEKASHALMNFYEGGENKVEFHCASHHKDKHYEAKNNGFHIFEGRI